MHEHPDAATSWECPPMKSLAREVGVFRLMGHMCAQGMRVNGVER